jgi:hypothetical protein
MNRESVNGTSETREPSGRHKLLSLVVLQRRFLFTVHGMMERRCFARRAYFIAAVVLAVGGCGRASPIQPTDDLLLAAISSEGETTRRDPAEIVDSRITRDTLHLTVRFGGGCRQHEFSLFRFGGFRESFPVQTDIRLMHDANGDMCRALLTRSLAFGLSPLARLYQQGYGAEHGAMILFLYGPAEESSQRSSLRYEF